MQATPTQGPLGSCWAKLHTNSIPPNAWVTTARHCTLLFWRSNSCHVSSASSLHLNPSLSGQSDTCLDASSRIDLPEQHYTITLMMPYAPAACLCTSISLPCILCLAQHRLQQTCTIRTARCKAPLETATVALNRAT